MKIHAAISTPTLRDDGLLCARRFDALGIYITIYLWRTQNTKTSYCKEYNFTFGLYDKKIEFLKLSI